VRLTLESDELPAAERETLEALITRADFFTLTAARGRPRPDAFQYDLAIEHAGRRHALRLHDPVEPEALRPLIERLIEMARAEGERA